MTIALIGLTPVMSSCSLSDFITKERDFTKMYIGGFPTVTYKDSDDKSDYFLYVKFRKSGETFNAGIDFESSSSSSTSDEFNPKYDFSVNLNSAAMITDLGVGSGLSFFNFAEYFTKYCSNYSDMKSYFTSGNYIEIFSSVGELKLDDSRCISKRARVGTSGEVIAFNTIGTNGSDLTYSASYVYKESLNLGGE